MLNVLKSRTVFTRLTSMPESRLGGKERCETPDRCRWPSLCLCSNISPLARDLQLSQRGFPELVLTLLRESGLRPELLELEVTESVVMQNEAWAVQALKELKTTGVEIAIDDFGTGYSSSRACGSFRSIG